MMNPALLPAGTAPVLQLVLDKAFHGESVPNTEIHNRLKRDASEFIEQLLEEGWIWEVEAGEKFAPTLRAILADPNLADRFKSLFGLVIAFAKRRYGKNKPQVSTTEIIDELDHLPPERFNKDDRGEVFTIWCGLTGLAPYLTAKKVGNSQYSILAISEKILSVSSLEDVLEAQQRMKADKERLLKASIKSPGAPNPTSPLVPFLKRLSVAGALPDTFLTMLERDAAEVEICRLAGAHKDAVILCGSMLEGVLVPILNQNPAIADAGFKALKKNKQFPKDAALPDLLELAGDPNLKAGVEALLRTVLLKLLSDLVRQHRDMVHPHAEMRATLLPVSETTAQLVYANLSAVLDDMTRVIEGGWLDLYKA